MPTEKPPSRYQVVERDGKLVVVDRTGDPAPASRRGRIGPRRQRRAKARRFRPIFALMRLIAFMIAGGDVDEQRRPIINYPNRDYDEYFAVALDESAIWRAGLSVLATLAGVAILFALFGFWIMVPFVIFLVFWAQHSSASVFGMGSNNPFPDEDGEFGEEPPLSMIKRYWLRWIAGGSPEDWP